MRNLIHEKFYLGPDRLAWDLWNSKGIHVSPSTFKRHKRKWLEATANFFTPAPSIPAWRFYERHHPHSLWHGDFMEKITLSDTGQTAYHLALMDDYSRGYVFCDLLLTPDVRTTIHAIITAMRQWQVIPKAIIFDNGSGFKGNRHRHQTESVVPCPGAIWSRFRIRDKSYVKENKYNNYRLLSEPLQFTTDLKIQPGNS